MTSPYDDPHFEPSADIQRADAHAYEQKIVELLRERLLPSAGPTIFLQSIELRGERPDTEVIFHYTTESSPRPRTARAALWQEGWVRDDGTPPERLASAMSVGGWLYNAWMADELDEGASD